MTFFNDLKFQLHGFDSLQRIGSLESFVLETDYTVYVLIHYKESVH